MTADTSPMAESAVATLRDRFRGTIIRPEDDAYDAARTVWNEMIDRRPALILRCTGAADVLAAVAYAEESDRLVAVRGGGHNVAGNAVCDGGIVIDLSAMDSVHVDPKAMTARVGSGATIGALDHETQAFGLATTGGIMSETGVAGLTLGGGLGWLARRFGLAHDTLRSVDVVTADGAFRRASDDEHTELFWGLRGGGGNFGIVTSFEFDLREFGPELWAGTVSHRVADAGDVLRFYRAFMTDAPDAVQCSASFSAATAETPGADDGEPVVSLSACYAGPVDDGKRALKPLGEFGDPLLTNFEVWTYTAWQQRSDDGWNACPRHYWKSHYFERLSDEAIDTLVEHVTPFPTTQTVAFFDWLGGAITRVDHDATAFPDRDKMCAATVAPRWTDPEDDERCIEWARTVHDALAPHAAGGAYVNYLTRDEQARTSAAYGDHYERLVALKNEYDPENLFQMNQNIKPTM